MVKKRLNDLDAKRSGIQMPFEYPTAQQYEYQINGRYFVKNHLKSKHKRLDFEWNSFQMVGTITLAIAKAGPFEIRPSKSPDLKCFRTLNGRISDAHLVSHSMKSAKSLNFILKHLINKSNVGQC